MAKSNRLIKAELLGGGRLTHFVSLGAKCKIIPGDIPEDYEQAEDFIGKPHYVCTDFVFKAKLRNMVSEELKDEEGNPLTLEEEILQYIFENVIGGKASLSFTKESNPSRLDFQHRLEPRGFIRDQKTKVITYGLTKKL